jgi:hypothetical protein
VRVSRTFWGRVTVTWNPNEAWVFPATFGSKEAPGERLTVPGNSGSTEILTLTISALGSSTVTRMYWERLISWA